MHRHGVVPGSLKLGPRSTSCAHRIANCIRQISLTDPDEKTRVSGTLRVPLTRVFSWAV